MKTYKKFDINDLLTTTKTPIVILSTPRSGSSVLGSYIQSLIGRDIPFYSEPDHYGRAGVDEFKKNFEQSKDFILKCHYAKLNWYGPEISNYLFTEAYKIRIKRKDFFKQVAGLYISICRQRWHYADKDNLNLDDAIPIDIERIKRNIEYLKICNNQLLQDKSIKYNQDLYYEDLPLMDNHGYYITPKPSNYDEILSIIKTLTHDKLQEGSWW